MILTLTLDGTPSNVMALVGVIATNDTAVKVTMSVEPQPVEYDDRLRPEDILNLPIAELELTVRTHNPLERTGIDTLRDLVAWTRTRLADLPQMTDETVTEVEKKLAPYGLGLKPESQDNQVQLTYDLAP